MNWNILKKAIIGLIVCCVLVTSMPSFSIRSEAVEAVIATETAKAYLTYLTSYFVSRGYSAPKIAQDPDNTLVVNGGNSVITNFVNSFIDKARLANALQTTALLQALEKAKNSGVFSLSAETESFLRDFLEEQNVNGSLVLGTTTETFNPISSGESILFGITYHANNASSVLYEQSFFFAPQYDYLPIQYFNTSQGRIVSITYDFIPLNPATVDDVRNNRVTVNSVDSSNQNPFIYSSGIYNMDGSDNGYFWRYEVSLNNSNFSINNFTLPTILTLTAVTNTIINNIRRYFQQNGVFENNLDLTSEVLYDTSNTDVLSVASEIDPSTGVVTPGFTYYMKDLSLFQQLIQQFNQGIISWNSLIKSLGLSSVASDASVATKEAAMDKVAYPDSTYDWLASTTWGETLTQPVVEEARKYHTDEVAKSDSIGELLAYQTGGDLPEEDKEKAYNSMLLGSLLMWLGIWRPPNLSGEDPDGGGIGPEDPDDPYGTSGYIADTVAGVSVTSGLIDAAFNSAGGSNGFGIVFTLGATFVIFSVLIGAANYFGSKGDDVENNNSSSKPNRRPARSRQKSKLHKVKKAG